MMFDEITLILAHENGAKLGCGLKVSRVVLTFRAHFSGQINQMARRS